MHATGMAEPFVAAPDGLAVDDMTARYDRPVSLAAALARRIAFFSLVLFAVAAFAHRFASLTIGHFLAIAAVAAALAAVGLLLAVLGLARLWAVGARGGLSSLAALACSLLVLAPIAYDAWLFFALPEISDVTSDPADPPQWLKPPAGGGMARRRRRSAAAAGEPLRQPEAYSGLVGRRYEGAIDRVLRAVRMAMADAGMKIVSETGADAVPPWSPPSASPRGSARPEGAAALERRAHSAGPALAHRPRCGAGGPEGRAHPGDPQDPRLRIDQRRAHPPARGRREHRCRHARLVPLRAARPRHRRGAYSPVLRRPRP